MSGNIKLKDIGQFMRDKIDAHFKAKGDPFSIRYIDPSYLVRSVPASAEDAILCDFFARNAVHAAMAGKTGLVIGYQHGKFTHVPVELLTKTEDARPPTARPGSASSRRPGRTSRSSRFSPDTRAKRASRHGYSPFVYACSAYFLAGPLRMKPNGAPSGTSTRPK